MTLEVCFSCEFGIFSRTLFIYASIDGTFAISEGFQAEIRPRQTTVSLTIDLVSS